MTFYSKIKFMDTNNITKNFGGFIEIKVKTQNERMIVGSMIKCGSWNIHRLGREY